MVALIRIAALGAGGIALALGAQKTVENLVGCITVIADRRVEAGDFCRVGETLGTVTDTGIHSTRIRTLQRTEVTIPNSDFASERIAPQRMPPPAQPRPSIPRRHRPMI